MRLLCLDRVQPLKDDAELLLQGSLELGVYRCNRLFCCHVQSISEKGESEQTMFEGDTIYSQSEVLAKRGRDSRPNVEIVTVKTTCYNQNGKIVITF